MRGVDVLLHNQILGGYDPFNKPFYVENIETVENVLIAPASAPEVLDTLNLTGRKAVYTLAIPKGDKHDWEEQVVEFFGEMWRVIGVPMQGIEHLIPLDWNKKVQVERYGESKD